MFGTCMHNVYGCHLTKCVLVGPELHTESDSKRRPVVFKLHTFTTGPIWQQLSCGFTSYTSPNTCLVYTVLRLDNVPESLKGLISSTDELKGRHSDYITAECNNKGSSISRNTNNKYGFVGPFNYMPNYKNPCWMSEGNHSIHCMPYFYLAGCPKSGTSDMFRRLQEHPDILSGNYKEVRWFDWYRFTEPAKSNFEYVLKFYAGATRKVQEFVNRTNYHYKVIGDGSPHTLFRNSFWQKIPENEGCAEPRVTAISQVHHLWPNAKVLLILRNPATRLYSAYLYNYLETGANRTAAQFHEWVLLAIESWQGCLQEHSFRFCMYSEKMRKTYGGALPFGIYSRYLLDALRVFPRDQIYVVQTEEWNTNMVRILQDVIGFLDLDPLPDTVLQTIGSKRQVNKGIGYHKSGRMWEKTRQLLTQFYAPFNRELADMMGDRKFLWADSKHNIE